ncbi:MAG: O-antigen ligase family protein [Clostridiales bacterium]|nr:O-antigen ligase family protein [Clostridiales bacterium]
MTLVPRLRPPRREQLPEWFACAFAAGVALLHPLIFDDFFFNINRFKFGVFAVSAYAGLIVFLLLCAARRRALAGEIRQPFSLSAADWGMGAFAVLAAASTILSDDAFSALTGDEGRLCGLVFILALAAMHVIVSRAQNADAWAAGGLLISGSLCALLGVLNFFKIDPFGFYPRLNQKSVDGFISTIGNVDFFSAFLCLFLPAAVAAFMRGGRWVRRLSVFPILLGTGAVIAARADGALIALASAILTALCLGALPLPTPSESKQHADSAAPRLEANLAESAPCSEENDAPSRFRRTLSSLAASLHGKATGADEEKKLHPQREARARMCLALACLMAGLFLVGAATRLWPDATLSLKDHACARLAAHPLLFAALSLLLTAAAYGLLHTRREKPVFPAPRTFLLTLLACAIVALAAAAALFLFYTYVDTDTKLTGMLKLFRFRDKWGTNRGGVWVRCMKLFAQSDWRVKLFGFGPDLLKKPLADAYGAEIAAYCNLSFNNAHNEYIQYLLTHGALGLTAYLTFAVGACASLFRRARKSAAAAGLLAGALAYLLHAAVNVNQPITTPLLFLFLSASVSVPTEPASARKNPRAQRAE